MAVRPGMVGLVGMSLFCASLGRCVTVAPWERETLARPDMTLGDDPRLAAGEAHALSYREGSSGGGTVQGGGCGCN